jgi:hypothetical protein
MQKSTAGKFHGVPSSEMRATALLGSIRFGIGEHFTTLAHFLVSSVMNLTEVGGEFASTMPPKLRKETGYSITCSARS